MRLDCLAPFPLRSATLPLTGENHPLRREFNKWMSWGNASTLLLSLLILSAYFALQRDPVVQKDRDVIIIIDPLPPPPIIEKERGTVEVIGPPPKFGIIEPRADLNPDDLPPFPTLSELRAATPQDFEFPGDGEWVFDPPEESTLPAPDVFVAVEVYPEKLRMDAPIYPELAREAGTEGTVVLRILVSKEGRVLDCIVMSGNPMLVEAAITAARTTVFRPALQAQKPVAVWVQLPIVFSLK